MLLVKLGNLKTKARRMFNKVKAGKLPSTEPSVPTAKDPGTSGALGNAQGTNSYQPVQTFLFCSGIPQDHTNFSAEYFNCLVSNLDSAIGPYFSDSLASYLCISPGLVLAPHQSNNRTPNLFSKVKYVMF